MDFHERMDITHALHTFWNPVSDEVMDELIWALDLDAGMRVLDIACGGGELLLRMAARHGIAGVGVDSSPFAVARARALHAETLPEAELEFVQLDGKAYAPVEEQPFDVACLVGASWIWSGFRGTLAALRERVRPGGLVLCGEPFWKVAHPPAPLLEAEGLEADDFLPLPDLLDHVEAAGFRLLYQIVSTGQDWDRYEMLQSLAVDRWAESHPDHPDRASVLEAHAAAQRVYLRWGRKSLGFATMILRRVEPL